MACEKHVRYRSRSCSTCADPTLKTWSVEPVVTLQAIASELGISVERVRQIEIRAIEKLRQGFRAVGVRCPMDGMPDEPMPRWRATTRKAGC